MSAISVTASAIKPYLYRCGYKDDLIQEDYMLASNQTVSLAAFAHHPLDARSSCFVAIDCETTDPLKAVLDQRELGAPLVFTCSPNRLQLWRPGPVGAECLEPELNAGQLDGFFDTNYADFAPSRIYDAKTLGRIPGSGRRLDKFVDVGLLPFAERLIRMELTDVVVKALEALGRAFEPEQSDKGKLRRQKEWILKSTFRLLAGKILKDKNVPAFEMFEPGNLEEVFQQVQGHYGSTERVELGGPRRRRALEEAAKIFQQFGNLALLTTEALADVYEEALITKETRKLRGTHGTPSYLVDYIVWQLAPWIAKIDPAELHVFEPACGHAPFLVGMVRLLRSLGLGMDAKGLSSFLRQRLSGIEVDQFALEIARLSLTVADVPNRNGWVGLKPGDMFAGKKLEDEAKRCRVMLVNPPFEGTRPLEVLQRTIPHLPHGAVFGFVAPAGLVYSPKPGPRQFREWLSRNCQLSEITLLPDGLFKYADLECVVVLGRRNDNRVSLSTTTRLRRVREAQLDGFKESYSVTTDRVVPQSWIASQENSVLWVPEYQDEVWCWLDGLETLSSIATLGQGLKHKNRKNLPPGTITVADEEFPDSVLGFVSSRGKPLIHQLPAAKYINLNPDTIERRGTGADTGKLQILVNYAPAGRGVWRIRAFIDKIGHPVTTRFITVRPVAEDCTLEYLWALCNSPVANIYVYANSLKRDILVGTMRGLPIPRADRNAILRVSEVARDYLEAAQRFDALAESGGRSLPLFNPQAVDEAKLHRLLKRLDAEVLRLYDLPARAEKTLLDAFAGKARPGVHGRFQGYYPQGFRQTVPLYAFLSNAYQAQLRGEAPALPRDQEDRYDELINKQLSEGLTDEEGEELHQLQAEVDGRDYALQAPDNSWLESIQEAQRETQRRLGEIADTLITITRNGSPSDDNSSP